MSEKSRLEKYIAYLDVLKEKLDGYFDDQKEFIACKAGCGVCCKICYYPVSELEYEYIKIGVNKIFNEEEKNIINQKVLNIYKDRKIFLKTNPDILKFTYECPFLINGSCGIYQYRALLCRSHGLIYKDLDKPKNNLPYCVQLGLNYANVYDKEANKLSKEKAEALGIKTTPKIYDLSYSSLIKDAGDLDVGDIRMLFEWLIIDIPNYEELIKEISLENI
jgi:hypothetical protein